jgi:RNA polymerase sigma factor (sigma-70 family)
VTENDTFVALIERLRTGDHEAARLLVEQYEPVLRRIVAVRLMDRKLQRLVDADDICQSVLGSFFVRTALGQYALAGEADLLKLLATMVRNKIASKERRRVLEKREERQIAVDELARHGTGPAPSEQLVFDELLREADRLLSPDERELIALRKQGLEWSEVAARLGGRPEGLRKRFARTVDLVVQKLGLNEVARDRL